MIKTSILHGAFSAICLLSQAFAQVQNPLKVSPIPGTPAVAPPPIPSNPPAPTIVPGPTPESTPADAKKTAPADPAKYTVQTGDNPWSIAKKHGIKLEDLLQANEIKNPKSLAIGDILLLPAGVSSANAPEAKKAPVSAPIVAAPVATDKWELYTVKNGDNPWKIAKALKVDHQKILSLNEGLDFQKLKIGQQIKVPKKQ